ncbi:hypothetical protein ACI8AC_24095 [Geodermatophilus sp. SYSU D00758]
MRVQDRLGTGLADLLGAARDVAPDQARAAFGLVSAMVSRPRGLGVSGIVQARGAVDVPRLGLSVEIRRLDDDRSTDSATFWEPEPIVTASDTAEVAAGKAALGSTERILAVLAPAARWAAVRLVVQSVFPRGARTDEQGLDRLLGGMLLAQSVDAFSGHAGLFRQRAVDDLLAAADSLAGSPLHLAALADTLDRLAASTRSDGLLYQQAHRQYARAVESLANAKPPMRELLQRYRVREATSWLDSGLPGPSQRARNWLRHAPPCFCGDASAIDLYDAACLFALAARSPAADGNLRSSDVRSIKSDVGTASGDLAAAVLDRSFLHQAGDLLLRAFEQDEVGGRLYTLALSDRQLLPLREWMMQVPRRPIPADHERWLTHLSSTCATVEGIESPRRTSAEGEN